MRWNRKFQIPTLHFWLRALLLLGLLGDGAVPVAASHKLPDGYSPFAYPVSPPAAPPVVQADPTATARPAPTPAPTPAPATGGLTLDRFALGFLLIVVGTVGVGLAVLGLRRARRLRDAAVPGGDPPARRS